MKNFCLCLAKNYLQAIGQFFLHSHKRFYDTFVPKHAPRCGFWTALQVFTNGKSSWAEKAWYGNNFTFRATNQLTPKPRRGAPKLSANSLPIIPTAFYLIATWFCSGLILSNFHVNLFNCNLILPNCHRFPTWFCLIAADFVSLLCCEIVIYFVYCSCNRLV